MKTLAKVSLILFVTAITLSSCEEENLVNDQPNGNPGSSISGSNSVESQTTDRADENKLDKIEETKEER